MDTGVFLHIRNVFLDIHNVLLDIRNVSLPNCLEKRLLELQSRGDYMVVVLMMIVVYRAKNYQSLLELRSKGVDMVVLVVYSAQKRLILCSVGTD